MCESFAEADFGSRCLREKLLLDFDWTWVGVHQKRVNIKSAITMAATMTSWSTAILSAKSILHIVH